MKRFLYIFLIFLFGCASSIETTYVKGVWIPLKYDKENNINIQSLILYNSENNETTIKIAFKNKNELDYVYVEYKLEVDFYRYYRDVDGKILREETKEILTYKDNNDFSHMIQSRTEFTTTFKIKGSPILGLSFNEYKSKKVVNIKYN